MAMPHAGLVSAAKDTKNGILQPEELEGVGEYAIRASVVSPAVNIVCANMNATELAPLIYVTWPNATTVNATNQVGQKQPWAGYQSEITVLPGETYLNSTVVDDIFQWGAAYGRNPPVFPMVCLLLSFLFTSDMRSFLFNTTPSPTYQPMATMLLIISSLKHPMPQLQTILSASSVRS